MASKKQRASSTARPGTAQPSPQAQSQGPTLRASAMQGTLRLAALVSATVVALLVFEVLQPPIGFWPALGIGFVAGVAARVAFVWLERLWLRAATRRMAGRVEQRPERRPPATKDRG